MKKKKKKKKIDDEERKRRSTNADERNKSRAHFAPLSPPQKFPQFPPPAFQQVFVSRYVGREMQNAIAKGCSTANFRSRFLCLFLIGTLRFAPSRREKLALSPFLLTFSLSLSSQSTVTTCSSGHAALSHLRAEGVAFDLVLSDVYMPGERERRKRKKGMREFGYRQEKLQASETPNASSTKARATAAATVPPPQPPTHLRPPTSLSRRGKNRAPPPPPPLCPAPLRHQKKLTPR